MKRERKVVHLLATIIIFLLAMAISAPASAVDSPYDGWYYVSGEDGTGISIEIQGNILFMAWYTYNQSGQPIWHTTGGPMSTATQYSGNFLLWSGTPLGTTPWAGATAGNDGTVQITFNSATQATLSWAGVGGTSSGSKTITKFMQDFSPGCLDSRDVTGWWYDPSKNGMGFFIEARGGSLFMAWYHYRDDSSPRWWSAFGAFPSGSHALNSTFLLYTGGQYIGGPYQAPPEPTSPSTLNLNFIGNSEATLSGNGFATLNLQRFWFGGMAGLPAVAYTGKNTAATIYECNYVTIAHKAVQGITIISLFQDLIPEDPIVLSNHLPYANYAEALVNPQNWMLNALTTGFGHTTYETLSDTIPGGCGGTLTYDITINETTFAVNGTITADNFCNNDATVNGSATVSGNFDLASEAADLTLTLNTITFTYPPELANTVNGSVTGTLDASGINVITDIINRDNNLGKVFWINNYTITASPSDVEDLLNTGEGSFMLTGRYYHPDYGYVDLSTPTGIQIALDLEAGTGEITSGAVVCTGNANTKAKLTPLSLTTFKVEADLNNDGIYEWDSGILNFDDYE
jgi:hypothetical protein